MAIHSIGLSEKASESADFSKVFIVRAGDDPTALFLKWRTASGSDVNASFDIAVNYRVVPNVTTEGGGLSGWATEWDTWASEIPFSSCNPQYVDRGWQWSINLATLLGMIEMGNASIMDILTRNGSFSFDNRYYDYVEIGIRIKSRYTDEYTSPDETIGKPGTATTSPRTDTSVAIMYVPEYTITGIYCDSVDAVNIECGCSEKWLRSDDRFCVESMKVGNVEIASSKPRGNVSYSGSGARVVSVPTSALSDIPIGETVYVDIRFNPSYSAVGEELARASKSLKCEGGDANAPSLTSKMIDGVLKIAATDSGGSKPIVSALLKVVGGDYRFDQMTIPISEAVAMPFVPRGVNFNIKAIGVADDGTVSGAVIRTETVDPLGWLTLVSIDDPSLMATASYDIDIKRTKQRESNTVKLANRPRPCTYYGGGGEVSIDASFSIPHNCMVEHPSETEDSWWDIAMAGDCVMLTADGRRVVVSVDDVGTSAPVDDDPVTMSVSLQEVDA